MTGFVLQQMLRLLYGKNVKGIGQEAAAQNLVLRHHLSMSRHTAFGKAFDFAAIAACKHDADMLHTFRSTVPIFNYEQMHAQWWSRIHAGERDISWPGATPFMALSSGTSNAASKFIPLSHDGIKSVRKAGTELAVALSNLPKASQCLGGSMLSINGSTTLQQFPHFMAGDFSGIMMNESPGWYRSRIVPARAVHAGKKWQEKLDNIVSNAPKWDVRILSGFPVWMVPMMEAIIDKYKTNTIHDIWPGVTVYMHGGMSIDPYLKRLDACFAKPIPRLESYVASEGYFANMLHPEAQGMHLVCDGGCFFEFIPFDAANFDETGQLRPNAQTVLLPEVIPNKQYALVVSNNSGAWRYMVGDVVTFVEGETCSVKWAGRTTQYISLVGEHVSIANLEAAFAHVFEAHSKEFAVLPDTSQQPFVHRWLVAASNQVPNAAAMLDAELCHLNDDYASLRKSDLLRHPEISWITDAQFLKIMAIMGKTDGQHKYPRVIAPGRLPADLWSAIVNGEGLLDVLP